MKCLRSLRPHLMIAVVLGLANGTTQSAEVQQKRRPYRLNRVDLKQQVIWGAECRGPAGQGLAFGGQDQDASDGRPHTRILKDGRWLAIRDELRAANPLQGTQDRVSSLRERTKNTLARARAIYLKGLKSEDEQIALKREIAPRLAELRKDLGVLVAAISEKSDDDYVQDQRRRARSYLQTKRQCKKERRWHRRACLDSQIIIGWKVREAIGVAKEGDELGCREGDLVFCNRAGE